MANIRIHQDVFNKAHSEIHRASMELKSHHSQIAKNVAEHVRHAEYAVNDLLNGTESRSQPGHIVVDDGEFRNAYGHVIKALDILNAHGTHEFSRVEDILSAAKGHLENVPEHHHPAGPHHSTHHKTAPPPPKPYSQTHGKSDEYAVVDRSKKTSRHHEDSKKPVPKPRTIGPPLPPKRKR